MPNYTYDCAHCDLVQIINTPIAKRDDVSCVFCDNKMARRPDGPNFALKGKGFHCVDYPKKNR